jgi:hypothetical protein
MIISSANNMLLGTSSVSAVMKGSNQVWLKPADISGWLNRITAIGGVAPAPTVQAACQTFVSTLTVYGLLAKILRLNLFCAGDWKGSFAPLIVTTRVGLGYDYNGRYAPNSSTQGPFGSADWSLTTGFNASSNSNGSTSVTGNTNTNTFKVIDTTVAQSAMPNYSAHMACYISGASAAGVIVQNTDMGVAGTNGQTFSLQCSQSGNSVGTSKFNCYNNDANSIAGGTVTPRPTLQGFYIGSRTANNYSAIYRAGAQMPITASGSNPQQSTATVPNLDSSTIVIFARGGASTYGASSKGLTNITDRSISMYSIGIGLNSTDVYNFNAAIVAFNTAIGRTNY